MHDRYQGHGRRNPFGSNFQEPATECPKSSRKNDFCRPIPNNGREEFRADRAVAEFAWKLFKKADRPEDYALSPLSPQILLSYLAWSAAGATKNELVKANGFGNARSIERLVETIKTDSYSLKKKDIDISTAFFVSEDLR